jgi:hypothetical protein
MPYTGDRGLAQGPQNELSTPVLRLWKRTALVKKKSLSDKNHFVFQFVISHTYF